MRNRPSLVQGIFIIAVALLLPVQAMAAMTISLPADAVAIAQYEAFIAEKGVLPVEVTNLKSDHANRKVAAFIIVQQALSLAGLPVRIEFVEVPNTERERMLVRDGGAVMSGQDLFSMAITEDVYKSIAIIPKGGFVKGIYTANNAKLMRSVKTLDDLRGFKGVSSTAWRVDWKTLEGIGLKELYSVPRSDRMFPMVESRRADFALLEFSARDDLSITQVGVTLRPVPGVKIGLADIRHFTVSKRHPDGKRVYEALNKGLAMLLESGTIYRYLTEVGFYNPAVKDWKLLNP